MAKRPPTFRMRRLGAQLRKLRDGDEDGRNGYVINAVTADGRRFPVSYFHPRKVAGRLGLGRNVQPDV